jgi:hypothetical protein
MYLVVYRNLWQAKPGDMPMRIRCVFFEGLAFLLIMLVVGGITAFATGPKRPQSNDPSRHNKPSSPQGAPAIIPRIHGTPAFTVEDVRLYYQSHPFSAGPTVSGVPPTIESTRFMTSHEAEVLLQVFIGRPDSAMVCVVEVLGPFYPTYVSVPPGQALPKTVDRGVAVFDAQTGNLLLWGFV